MLRRTASAGDFEHLHFLPDAAANSTVVSERGAGMGRPDRRLRPESSKPFGILEVSATTTEVPCSCTDIHASTRGPWHHMQYTVLGGEALSGQDLSDVGLRNSSVVGLSTSSLQVPEEGEGAEVKAPLLMTQGRQH